MRTNLPRSAFAVFLFNVAPTLSAESATPATPHLPEMSYYNCATVQQDATAGSLHVGQVINGTYNEWDEIYVNAGGHQRLACISIVRPTPRQLTRGEAENFLTSSFAVGTPSSSPTGRAQSAPEDFMLDAVPAEPLKRVKPEATPASSSESRLEKKSSAPDMPPIPATKNFGEEAPQPAPVHKSTKERSNGLIAPDEAVATPQTVGVEDRQVITTTQTFPWETLAYLEVTYPQGGSYRCSATIVSPYVVLTAGHCVHNQDRGGYISSARVYAAQSQAAPGSSVARPYGVKSDLFSAQTTQQWTEISGEDSHFINQYRYDVAAIDFKTPFTHTSTFMPVLYNSTASPITSAGYPANFNNGAAYGLYSSNGSETSRSINQYRETHVREFTADASGGNSGGPFIYTNQASNQRYLVGSLSYGEELDDKAGGPWYDSWNQSLVSGWVSWTPAAAAGTTSGLRVANVFSSTQNNFISYLRFYNSSSVAGTVDVTLADRDTGIALGRWTSPTIAPHSSRQFGIDTVENNTNVSFTKSPAYSITVRSTFTGMFQNTLLRRQEGTFSNLTTCDVPSTEQMTLINVHSSLLPAYPAGVVIHNTGTSGVSVSFGIFNADNGVRLGTYVTAIIPANAHRMLAVSQIESGARIAVSGVLHYVIKADVPFTGYLQHLMNNTTAGFTTDMTAACALAP